MIETVHTRIWDDLEYNSDDDSDTPNGVGDDSQDKVHESTGRATFGSITRVNIGAQRHYEIDWSCRTRNDLLHLPPELIQFVCSSFEEMDKVVFVQSTSVMCIHFDVIRATNQTVPYMIGL